MSGCRAAIAAWSGFDRDVAPDRLLLIAATAESPRLTVLHANKDFDLIAAFTNQPIERLDV